MKKILLERKKRIIYLIFSMLISVAIILTFLTILTFKNKHEKLAQVSEIQLKAASMNSSNSFKETEEDISEAVLPIKISHTDFEIDVSIKSLTQITNGTRTGTIAPPNNKLAKTEVYRKSMDNSEIEIVFDVTVTNNGNASGYVDNVYSYLPSTVSNISRSWATNGEVLSSDSFGEIAPGESVTQELVVQGDATKMAGTTKNYAVLLSSDDINQRILEKAKGRAITNEDIDLIEDTNNYSSNETIVSVSTGLKGIKIAIIIISIVIVLIISAIIIKLKLKHNQNNKK